MNPEGEKKHMTLGVLLPRVTEEVELLARLGQRVSSFIDATQQTSVCMIYANSGDCEQAEAAMGEVLTRLDPDGKFEHRINSGSADEGVDAGETDTSL